MKPCSVVLLITLLACVGIASAQTAVDASDRPSYYLPYKNFGADAAVISIVNPHVGEVSVTVTVEDDFGNRIDTLSDRLGPNETRSFPASSLPSGGASLHIEANARLEVGILYTRDGTTFETRIVEPEQDAMPPYSISESVDDAVPDSKRLSARAAIATTYGSTCGGQSSSGNPYPCGNGGNCTWWSWKTAKDYWGVSLPGWGAHGRRRRGTPIIG